MRLLAFIAILAVAASPAGAQTYSTWKNPDPSTSSASNEKLQDFVDKLNALIDKAEQARAADPQFLRDLRDLARGFDRPWRKLVFDEGFLDGNFSTDPAWRVTSGEYWLEKGWGLRSAIEPEQAATRQEQTVEGKDAAAVLLGQILNQALGGKQSGQTGGGKTARPPTEAAIHTDSGVSNAFSIGLDFSSWASKGHFEIGVYQGTYRGAESSPGYRLVYSPGGNLELRRISYRGVGIVDRSAATVSLEDKAFHHVERLRHADGRMIVSVDGKELLSTSDRGFRDAFAGVTMVNRGGDYIVKRVTIYGTP